MFKKISISMVLCIGLLTTNVFASANMLEQEVVQSTEVVYDSSDFLGTADDDMATAEDIYVPNQSDPPNNLLRMGYGRLLCSITSSSAGLKTTYSNGYSIRKSDFTYNSLMLKSSTGDYRLADSGGLCTRNPYDGSFYATVRGYFSGTNGTAYMSTSSLSSSETYYGFIQANAGVSGTVWFYDD